MLQKVYLQASFCWNYQVNISKHSPKSKFQISSKDIYFKSILLGGLVFLDLRFLDNRKYACNSLFPKFPSTSFLMEYKTFRYNSLYFIIIVFFHRERLASGKSSGYSVINDHFSSKRRNGDRLQVCRNGRDLLDASYLYPIIVGLAVARRWKGI